MKTSAFLLSNHSNHVSDNCLPKVWASYTQSHALVVLPISQVQQPIINPLKETPYGLWIAPPIPSNSWRMSMKKSGMKKLRRRRMMWQVRCLAVELDDFSYVCHSNISICCVIYIKYECSMYGYKQTITRIFSFMRAYIHIYIRLHSTTQRNATSSYITCIHTGIHADIPSYLPPYLPTNLYTYLPMHLHIPTYTYIYLHIPTYTYIYLHIPTYTYIYLHIPTYTYIYLHTHRHTHIPTHIMYLHSLGIYLGFYLDREIENLMDGWMDRLIDLLMYLWIEGLGDWIDRERWIDRDRQIELSN